jgi:predicted Zn-dependent protease
MQYDDTPAGGDGFGSADEPQQRRGKFKILPLMIFAVVGVFYYFSHQEEVPITGRKQMVAISPSDEMALGLQSYSEILRQSEIIQSGPDVDLIRSVGQKIAKATGNQDYQWEFNLIRSNQANAFCLPGGKVAVYSGILPIAKNADGLAVVMGHEIAHAIARHGAERMAQDQLAQMGQMAMGMAVGEMDDKSRRNIMGAFGLGTQFGILLPFSRKHESEADHIGLVYMARACFDPNEAARFWERMEKLNAGGKPPEFASTHPSDERRIDQLNSWLPEALSERSSNCS